MTGRIFTADHQVYDLPPLLAWNVKHTGTVPCDSWSVTAVYKAEMAPVLKMAAGFAAMENGTVQLRGIVDEYEVELGSGGLTVTLSGRGYAARLLAPLGLYDLNGVQNRSELAALGTELDSVSAALDAVERESLLATAEDQGLSRREALFARKPAAVTAEERRAAIAALLRIGEDSLTPEAINDTLVGCGIRARAEEKTDGGLRVVFPGTAGVPAEFDQIQKIILDILPCHLDVEFYFRYLTWAECEAAEYTWNGVESAGHTWESFSLAVPAEV